MSHKTIQKFSTNIYLEQITEVLSDLQSETLVYQHFQSETEKPERRRGRNVALSVFSNYRKKESQI